MTRRPDLFQRPYAAVRIATLAAAATAAAAIAIGGTNPPAMAAALIAVVAVSLLIGQTASRRRRRQAVRLRCRTRAMARRRRTPVTVPVRRAEWADEARRRLLTAVSHDLRQPMQALRLYLEFLDSRLTDPAQRGALGGALSAQAAGEEVLRHYLDIATLETDIVDPVPGIVPIDGIIAEIVGECRPLAMAKRLELRWVPCHVSVTSDPGLLRPMLRHLTVNAIRFTERGRVLIGCRRRGGHLRVEVWDTGIGIAESDLPHVFEDFYQIGNSECDRRKGLGLGLAVVARTARLLDHDIAVASRLNRGSVFALTLPLAGSAAARNAA